MSFEITTEANDGVDPTIDEIDKVPPSSILGKLREAAKEQQNIKQQDFPVGGEFGTWLYLRYQPLSPEEVDRFLARRGIGEDVKVLELNMDLISRGCVAVIGHNPDTGEEIVLTDSRGAPFRITHELAEYLEFPIPPGPEITSRDVVMMLFGGNGMAIANHGDEVVTWMQNPENVVDPGEA